MSKRGTRMQSRCVRYIATVIVFSILLTLFLPLLPVSADTDDSLPLNAQVNVARGEEAFMKSTHDFSANWIWNSTDNGYGIPATLTVKVSSDNKTWTTVYQVTNPERPTEGPVILDFDAIEARYVKVEGSKLRKNPDDGNRCRMQIAELEVYNVYRESQPPVEEESPAPSPSLPSADSPQQPPDTPVQKGSGIGWIIGGAIALAAIATGTLWWVRKRK